MNIKQLPLLLLGFLVVLCGCSVEHTANYTPKTVSRDTKYLYADINFPYFSGENSFDSLVNSTISSALLVMEIDSLKSLEQELSFLEQEALELAEIRGEAKYSYTTTYNVSFYDDITSIRLYSFIFTGGAHPNYYTRFFNFDKTGKLLEPSTIASRFKIQPQQLLELIASQKGLDVGTSAQDQGLFYDWSEIPLPENIGFENDSLVVLYNPYEIAPYAFGDTELKLPIE